MPAAVVSDAFAMSSDLGILSLLLIAALVGFVTGKLRYDVVALLTLLLAALFGVVPMESAFSGFGHPAVVTVAAVLVISRAFFQSGLVDALASLVLRAGKRPTMQVLALTLSVAVLSSFMNNVGALALMLPVGLQLSRTHGMAPSKLLMPLSFGSLLGGLTTLIGTPPNVIIATFWGRTNGTPFGFFDFAPVGVGVALAGILFIALLGWRLLPNRKGQSSPEDRFQVASYLGELRVQEKSRARGMTLREMREDVDGPPPVLAVLRGDEHVPAFRFRGVLQAGDVLVVEGETREIDALAHQAGLAIGLEPKEDSAVDEATPARDGAAAEKSADDGAAGDGGTAGDPEGEEDAGDDEEAEVPKSRELELGEAVVMAQSRLVGLNVREAGLLSAYDLTLIAVSRAGKRLRGRLRDIRFEDGDILLVQGPENVLVDRMNELGCLPLADRELRLGKPRKLALSAMIFALAITAISFGWVSAAIGMVAAAVLMVVSGVVSLRRAYDGIDWPVLVLLACMIPVGEAFETTGGAAWLANQLLTFGSGWAPIVTLGALLVATMCLSDVINNAAAAVLMAPIGHNLAQGLQANSEPFLMAVAIGASCAFLTPIGHQSNTLVFGPGGYRFGDYWKLGLPVQLVMLIVALPLLVWVWPLH